MANAPKRPSRANQRVTATKRRRPRSNPKAAAQRTRRKASGRIVHRGRPRAMGGKKQPTYGRAIRARVSGKLHRNWNDNIWVTLLNMADAAAVLELLGLKFAVVEVVPPTALKNWPKEVKRPDCILFVSNDPDDSWAKAKARLGDDSVDSGELLFINIEVKTEQRASADGDQLYENKVSLRTTFGRMAGVGSLQLVTGDRPPAKPRIPVDGGTLEHREYARSIFVGNLHASRVPAALRVCPFGSLIVLLLPGGDTTEEYLQDALNAWPAHSGWMPTGYFLEVLRIRKKLCNMLVAIQQRSQGGQVMANGKVATDVDSFPELIHAINAILGNMKDWDVMPVYRERNRKQRQAQQRAQHAQQRAQHAQQRAQHRAEQAEATARKEAAARRQAETVARKEAAAARKQAAAARRLEKKLATSHVTALLAILAERSIKLSSPQRQRLQRLDYSKLPSLSVARKATSAKDFLHRAGLVNGR